MKNAIGKLLGVGETMARFEMDYGVEVVSINPSVEKAVIRITASGKNRSRIFIYGLSEGENLKLQRVETSLEVEIKVSTPLMNSGQGKVVDGIVVLQLQKNELIAAEFGVIVVGRTERAIRKFLYKAPYAMDRDGKLAIEGIVFEPLKAEIKKHLARGIADKLGTPLGMTNNPSKFMRGAYPNPVVVPEGKMVYVKDVNMLRGTATGVAKLKEKDGDKLVVREILIDLANFSNRDEALVRLRPSSIIIAREYHILPAGSQHFAKALKIIFPVSKKSVEKKVEGGSDAKAKEAPKAEVATEKAKAVVNKEVKSKVKKVVAPKKAAPKKTEVKTTAKTKLKKAA